MCQNISAKRFISCVMIWSNCSKTIEFGRLNVAQINGFQVHITHSKAQRNDPILNEYSMLNNKHKGKLFGNLDYTHKPSPKLTN